MSARESGLSAPKLPAATVERFSVTYRITVTDGRTIEDHATDITLEQSVEIPADVVPDSVKAAGVIGRIESIEEISAAKKQFDVVISFRIDNAAYSITQFLNVIYGNISIKRGIKIRAFDLPQSLLQTFGGPIFGIEGIRKITGVYGRPLSSTALKPVGLSSQQIADMAGAYARGGLDLIKEDHGMADMIYHRFDDRIARCQEAVANANAKTGHKTLFFPMINGGFDEIERQFAYAKSLGITGALVAPLLVGMDTIRVLSKRYEMIVMAHPTFTGTHFHDPDHGMTPAALLGTLFRLFGTDISVFPNAGGRFSFTEAECLDLAAALRSPLGSLKTAFPAPAGGMKIDRIGSLAEAFGPDTVLLIGGGLMQYSSDLEKSAAFFMQTIHKAYNC